MAAITTRRMDVGDIHQVMMIAGYMHHISPFYKGFEFSPLTLTRNLLKIMEDDDYLLCVAERRGEVVGIVIGQVYSKVFSPDKEAMDQGLFTPYPDEGIGTQLINAYTEWARSKGAKRITILAQSGIPYQKLDKKFSALGYEGGGKLYSLTGM